MRRVRAIIAGGVIAISLGLWFHGLAKSPIMDREQHRQKSYVENYLRNHAPNMVEEQLLAETYWKRYPDVGQDSHFGKNGTMGIFGARAHFDQHGKREGRLWGK